MSNNDFLTIKDHHLKLIRRTKIVSINKLPATELYSSLMSNVENKPTSQIYFENDLSQMKLSNGTKHITTSKSYIRHIFVMVSIENFK